MSDYGHTRYGGRGTRTTEKLLRGVVGITLEKLEALLRTPPPRKDKDMLIDPWAGSLRNLNGKSGPADPAVAPVYWHDLGVHVREVVGGAAVRLLALAGKVDPRDVDRVANKLWTEVRVDEEVALQLGATNQELFILRDVVRKLLALGDVERVLRARMDELAVQLARVAKLRGATAGGAQ